MSGNFTPFTNLLKAAKAALAEMDKLPEGHPESYGALAKAIADAEGAIQYDETDRAIIEQARTQYERPSNDDLEIDDKPFLSHAEDGCWVSAWVWVKG